MIRMILIQNKHYMQNISLINSVILRFNSKHETYIYLENNLLKSNDFMSKQTTVIKPSKLF